MSSDLLAMWWRIPVTVKPYLGHGPDGPAHGEPVTILARVSPKARLVRDATGAESVASSRVSYAVTEPLFPLESLADTGDGRWRRVIEHGTHVSGLGITPDHNHLSLE